MPELFAAEPRESGGAGLLVRRLVMCLLALVVALGLLNVFGQEATVSRAATQPATLELSAPRTVRGGLLVQGRIQLVANRTISDPQLVLDHGWFEGMQVNTIEPAATDEAPGTGRTVVLTYGRLEAGDVMTVWLQMQVDPTFQALGTRSLGVELRDGGRPLATVNRDITVLP
jgi:hypothetical protein